MTAAFDRDDRPGAVRVLFVGWPDSSHTHAWIDLVRERCNVRLYALPRGLPPDDWPVRTYVTQATSRPLDRANRRKLYPGNTLDRDLRNWLVHRRYGPAIDAPRLGLARVIRRWRPHVVHVLGLDPAGRFALGVRERFGLGRVTVWVLQLRGGSDLALASADTGLRPTLSRELAAFDWLLTDNRRNPDIVAGLGVPRQRFAPFVPVPGSGGMDLAALAALAQGPPSTRRDILWPKAYECPWSKALPVFEALRLCRDRLAGHRVHMLAADEQTRAWYHTLPEAVRRVCPLRERIPRAALLRLLGGCRVMLAPSLVDGVPNSLYEAMALGAFPVVSPLETITPLVREPEHVLFARNLYPEEIAAALVRALTDDVLVDAAAARNRELVASLADRTRIAPAVLAFYENLAQNMHGIMEPATGRAEETS